MSETNDIYEILDNSDVESPKRIMRGPIKCYQRKLPSKWLHDPRFTPWLSQSKINENKAFCNICDGELTGSIAVIERHDKTDKHLKNISMKDDCNKVTHHMQPSVSSSHISRVAALELKPCSIIVERNLLSSPLDHLAGQIPKECLDSEIAKDIKCARTEIRKMKVETADDDDATPCMKKKYTRKFQTEWLRDSRFSSWISPCGKNENDAFCTMCSQKISGGVTLLERHRRTKKHLKKVMHSTPLSAHEVFPQFFTKKVKMKTDVDDEDCTNGNFTSDDFEVQCPVNVPGDHSTYIISTSAMHPEKNVKLEEHTTEAANFLHHNMIMQHDEEDEFDHFGRSIAIQLRKLPEEYAVSLISEMQCLITQKRLKVIADTESQTP